MLITGYQGYFSHLLKTTRVINKNCHLNFQLIDLLSIFSKYSSLESRILKQKGLESLFQYDYYSISDPSTIFTASLPKYQKQKKLISYGALCVLDVNIVKIRENIGKQFSKCRFSEMGICKNSLDMQTKIPKEILSSY